MASKDYAETDFDPEYYPDLQQFTRNRSERLEAIKAAPVLSEELQLSINLGMRWDGADLDPNTYTWEISSLELDEIDKCCAEYTCEFTYS
ncbi:hypothetical protein N7471_013336 [Penicillium samsonianum]|uniref:uncharacterized protein n=1 Tax=Penicillium samsonianum TaxID=1882272 RepID=UPI0025483934|nr:uncharacterized protein N7471_013336 [Penicillium samsonianum]KAJ6118716.1 hypothetical protein N7471_013336 [Penicillium samsonianum]